MVDEFEDRVKNVPPSSDFWAPEKGSYIVGKYMGVRKCNVSKGEGIAIVIEDEISLDRIMIWRSAILKKEFEKQKIKEGERVGLKYHGRSGKTHLWGVLVDRPKEPEKE